MSSSRRSFNAFDNVVYVEEGHVPEGAVPMGPRQILERNVTVLDRWPNRNEVFMLRHGSLLLGGLAAFSSCYFLHHYRTVLQILPHAHGIMSYGIAILLPGGLVHLTQRQATLSRILSGEHLGHRRRSTLASSLGIQAAIGWLWPMIVTPMLAIFVARRHLTYQFAPMTRLKRKMSVREMIGNPLHPRMTQYLLASLLVAYGVFQKQTAEFDRIMGFWKFRDGLLTERGMSTRVDLLLNRPSPPPPAEGAATDVDVVVES